MWLKPHWQNQLPEQLAEANCNKLIGTQENKQNERNWEYSSRDY